MSHWAELLDQARTRHADRRSKDAFEAAFKALEVCYGQHVPSPPETWDEDRFVAMCRTLLQKKRITRPDFELARYLARARNVVLHRFGFEPSLEEALRCITRVQHLCARFAQRVCDVMTKPVRCARRDEPVGALLREMREQGFSQFPVVDDAGFVIGTLDERAVFDALHTHEGILDPETPVAEVMRPEVLPAIDPLAGLDRAWELFRQRSVPALLVLNARRPVGIVTKFDLVRSKEL
jgi:CBS domain-containing protein